MEKLLNVPEKIHVGYQKRKGTYTGKLAYVIYTDQKGKRRKESSWESWRDKEISPENFDNVPTTGFVLNKGVGGQRESWGWNARNEYIRVYDPRGFEFEISVANLLFILTNCSSIKGKGLEGEFVYAWDGPALILLPVDCYEYKTSTEFTALQSKKITKKDMKEGLVYQHKNTHKLVYMGRYKVRSGFFDRYKYRINDLVLLCEDPADPRHIFWDLDAKEWQAERGFTKLASIVSEECHPDFANLYSEFESSKFISRDVQLILSPVTIQDVINKQGLSRWFYIKVEGGYQLVYVSDKRYRHYFSPSRNRLPKGQTEDHFWPVTPFVVKEVTKTNLTNRWSGSHYEEHYSVSASYLEGKELFTPEILLNSKTKIEVENYVKRHENQSVTSGR